MKNGVITRRSVILAFAILSSLIASSQTGKISGILFSSSNKDIIPQATVSILGKDSSVRRSMLSDSLGKFNFDGLAGGQYILQVQSLSYQVLYKNVAMPVKGSLKLDSVFLQPSYDALGSVVISAKRTTVLIKNDTTEFTAASFRVRKNGTVEDVLKKMPGVEVDKNGGVKAQGETVTQIYVDGKPFFGTDIKSVTQNFPADVIDKIQIIDKRSDQALATKVEDGVHEKIINVTLKKNRKKGAFGKDYAGYGTNNRYEAKANTNFFNNDRKISIIAGANNTGRNDNNNSGADDASYNNWNGVLDSKQLKINYADKYGKDFDFSAWAGYERNKNVRMQDISRQNIFTDSSTYYTESNHSTSISNNFYSGLYFEYRPDTLTFVRFNESAGYNRYDYTSNSLFNTSLQDSSKFNNGNRYYSNTSKSPTVNGQVSYDHRFANSRRNIFINVNNNINTSKAQLYNISNNFFFPVDSTAYSLLLNQLQFNDNRTTRIGATVSYSEPVGEKSTVNVSYNYNYSVNDAPKQVFDYNSISELYDILNDTLSNHYNNYSYNNVVSLNYNYGSKNTGFGAGMRWQNAIIKSQPVGKDSLYQQSYNGWSPNLSFYSNGKGRRFNIYYSFGLQAPQAYQLQPLVDNTNPLYIKLGNPGLKYAEVHTVRYNFNYYNSHSQRGFNSNAGFSSIINNITNSTTFNNTNGSQVTQPINTDGAYNWNAWFSYYSPIYFGKDKIKWDINLYTNAWRNVNLLNGDQNVNQSNYAKVYLGLTYDTPKWMDFHTDFSLSRQATQYSLQPDLNTTSYFVDVSPNITLVPATNTEINIDYDYRQTTGQSAGFNTAVNILNADVVQYFGEKKAFWVKLKAYDLLNENVSIWRSTADNYIQDTRANVLSRFLLLSLNFRLNKFNSSNTANIDIPDDSHSKM
ncbi:MAG TPA: TonB-dependent receptor [Chitinophagaceae bacterium]|nr:TonB-dependent receptor [Chitinophagaceae bacterium]